MFLEMFYYSLLAVLTVTSTLPSRASSNEVVGKRYFVWPPPTAETMFAVVCIYDENTTVNIFGGKNGVLNRMRQAISVGAFQCLTPIFFLSRDTNYEFGLVETSVDRTISVMVHISVDRYTEAYMGIHRDHWNTHYVVAHTKLYGFISVMSEKFASVLLEFPPLKNMAMIVNVSSYKPNVVQDCEISNRKRRNLIKSTETKLTGNVPFGVISGYCPSKEATFLIQSDYPEYQLPYYQFVTFCVIYRSCSTQIHSTYSTQITIVSYITGQCAVYFPETVPSTRTFYERSMLIYSNVFLQVSIFVEKAKIVNDLPQYIAMINLVPSALLLRDYIWAAPPNCKKHFAIIVSSDTWDQLVFYVDGFLSSIRLINTFSDDANASIEYKNWHIVSVEMPVATSGPPHFYHISSVFFKNFGCYAYGVQEKDVFASAIGVNDLAKLKKAPFVAEINSLGLCEEHNCDLSKMMPGDYVDNDCDGYIDEEIDNEKDDDEDGATDEDVAVPTESGCLPGWFGTRCDQMCLCEGSQCKADGNCFEDVPCRIGYFGSQCQFNDELPRSLVSNDELDRLRGLKKCQNSSELKSPVLITFKERIKVILIQFESLEKDHLSDISLSFQKPSHVSSSCFTGECPHRRDIFVNDNTLMTICLVPDYVCQLNITYEKTRQWCGIYVSKGRNVALGKKVSMSSQYRDSQGTRRRPTLAVDGETLISDYSCARTDVLDSEPSWRIEFMEPMILYEIVVYFESYSYNENFTINYFDRKGELVQSHKGEVKARVSHLPQNQLHRYVKSIVVSLQSSVEILAICEFEAYGECAPPLYGHNCSDICSITCDDQICTYDGFCLQCPKGTGGLHCFDGCLSWCEDDEEPIEEGGATTVASQTVTPTQVQTGFSVENFWYYVMVGAVLLYIVCMNAYNYPMIGRRRQKAANFGRGVRPSTQARGRPRTSTFDKQGFSRSSSVDAPSQYREDSFAKRSYSYSQSSSVDYPSETSDFGGTDVDSGY